MPPTGIRAALLALVVLSPDSARGGRDDTPPALPREFRGAWVASVHNLNWPSKPGLSSAAQKAELTRLLERAAQLRLNAVVLQVRPSCDALYESSLEPWSQYLTGRSGQAPSPRYDPLEFAVAEAHRLGLELHAWFNPFRAQASAELSPAASHVLRTHPEAICAAGSMKWLDPGLEFSRRHTLAVICDVVRRYDIDGVHIDDYFYPYPTNPRRGPHPFEDGASYAEFRAGGGRLSLADWRRRNIDGFVQSLYAAIKAEKPWVKFGVSPFGIWRPGHPAGIEAELDSFEHIFADSRKWLREGWCDYFCPQLYWRIDDKPHSFPALLDWWKDESASGRHVWPGIASDRVASDIDPRRGPEESLRQIEASRGAGASNGHIHWSIAPLLEDRRGLARLLSSRAYGQLALVPASPWLSRSLPAPPAIEVSSDSRSGGSTLRIDSGASAALAWWALQISENGVWTTAAILPASRKSFPLEGRPDAIAATAIDRYGNASAPSVLTAESE